MFQVPKANSERHANLLKKEKTKLSKSNRNQKQSHSTVTISNDTPPLQATTQQKVTCSPESEALPHFPSPFAKGQRK